MKNLELQRHCSEVAIEGVVDTDFDYVVVNDGTLEDLFLLLTEEESESAQR